MDIYKIVVNYEGTLETELVPRIYFSRDEAFREAKAIIMGGYYEERPVNRVVVYREMPDAELGWYRTIGQQVFNQDNKDI